LDDRLCGPGTGRPLEAPHLNIRLDSADSQLRAGPKPRPRPPARGPIRAAKGARVSHFLDTDPASPIRLLLVEEEGAEAESIRKLLENAGDAALEIDRVVRVDEARALLGEGRHQVALLDLALPEALQLLPQAKGAAAGIPFIVMTETADEELGVNALRLGARDHFARGQLDPRLLVRMIRGAVERSQILDELKRSRQREHMLATHDSLTGLPNRCHFQDLLRRAMANASRSAKSVAILFVDLDRFKNINDTLGHPAGDELLKIVAERLRALTRRSDTVARLGGDEFAVMLQNVSRDHAPAIVAAKILDSLGKPYPLANGEWWVTSSIGIAVFPRDGIDLDALIRNADTALYDAKAQSPNGYHFWAEQMNQVVAERLGLENSLHEAIERSQFVLQYQPQIDIATGTLLGAEALLRWDRPGYGLLPPEAFLRVAEEAGLVNSIGEWMLRTACEDAARWNRSRDEKIRIAVNVSSLELARKSFVDDVVRVLRDTGLDASQLELEIAESSVRAEGGVTRATLLVLRRLGIRVAIDDFGMGSTSLVALKSVPLDGLKIHRDFVRDIPADAANATIAKALIRMARGLGLATAAEGVDSEDQARFLYTHGCHRVQGALLGDPVGTGEFGAQLESSEPPWKLDLRDFG
jgi:diguanylate cyclase (GGDEF)-like protein